jgi:hypothetical protein
MENIPSKELLGHLPHEAGEEGGIESRPETDLPIGNDLIGEKSHPECKEEGKKVFQDESKNHPYP